MYQLHCVSFHASLHGMEWGHVMVNVISAMSLAAGMKVFRLYPMTSVHVLLTSWYMVSDNYGRVCL